MEDLASRVSLCKKALEGGWIIAVASHRFTKHSLNGVPDGLRVRDLRENEVIFVHKKDKSGWWTGQVFNDLGGTFVFPGSFATVVGKPVAFGSCTKASKENGLDIGDKLLIFDGQGTPDTPVFNSRSNVMTNACMDNIVIVEKERATRPSSSRLVSDVKEIDQPSEDAVIPLPGARQGPLAGRRISHNEPSEPAWRVKRCKNGIVKSLSSSATWSGCNRRWKVVVSWGVRFRDRPHLAAVTHPVKVATWGMEVFGDENIHNWIECDDSGLWLPVRAGVEIQLARCIDTSGPGYACKQSAQLTYEDFVEIQAFRVNIWRAPPSSQINDAILAFMEIIEFPPEMATEANLLWLRLKQKYPDYFSTDDGNLKKELGNRVFSELYYHAALVLLAVEKHEFAGKMLTRAIAKHPAKHYHFNLGFLFHRELQDEQAATRAYKAALELDGEYERALFFYAEILANNSDTVNTAIGILQRVVERNRLLTAAHFALARLYQDAYQNTTLAMGYYEEVIRLEPYCVDARYNLALICWQDGQYDQADYHFESCKKAGPKNIPVLLDLANFWMDERGDHVGAYNMYERILHMQPNNPEAQLGIASLSKNSAMSRDGIGVQELRGDPSEIKEQCNNQLELREESGEIYQSNVKLKNGDSGLKQGSSRAAQSCSCIIL